MLAIKNNLMAENAARQLGLSYDALAQSIERLSSGLRINSAKDDAAGLAVRELMRADLAVIRQGSRNAQDGISMLQTMEGAMGSIDEALIRMKELAEQAATGSYSTQQRNIMNNEYGQMIEEIDRVANRTEFNTTTMLNSATGSSTIHFGIDSNGSASSISVSTVDVRSLALGINADTMSAVSGSIAGVIILICAIALILRRLSILRVKEISNGSDYVTLLLIIAILFTGDYMRFAEHFELSTTRVYFQNLFTFSVTASIIPQSGMFALHFILAQILIIFIPFSKIMHFGGIFFTQTVIQKS